MPSTAGEPVLIEPTAAEARSVFVDGRNLDRPILWVGVVLTAISVANIALLWWPPRFGNAQWEFAAVTQTVGRMPMLAIGLVLVMLAVLMVRSVWWTRLVAAFLSLTTLVLIAMGLLYMLSGIVAYKQAGTAPGGLAGQLEVRILATAIATGIYTLLFGALAATSWRRLRHSPARGRSAVGAPAGPTGKTLTPKESLP